MAVRCRTPGRRDHVRGIELILKGRDPRDAWAFAQRICGVCTTVHAIASIRRWRTPSVPSLRPTRASCGTSSSAAQCIQDHVIHFYHLHALDWVDVVSALSADPAKTSALAQSISDWPLSSTKYFTGVKTRLKDFVDRGQLGPFANAYWGHPAYKLPPEANLMAVAHYLEALDWQREFIKIHAILGGKNPHLQSFLVGGMATPVDPNRQASLNIGTIAQLKALDRAGRSDFVTKVYLPDVLAVAGFYKDWAACGGGVGNYMVYGEYPENDAPSRRSSCPRASSGTGTWARCSRSTRRKITESVKHSWYDYAAATTRRSIPARARPGPSTPGPSLRTSGWRRRAKYSWLKSPRYGGEPMEVGPLARMLVAYGSGHKRVQELVGTVLGQLKVGPEALFSTLGRIAARCIETVLLAEKMDDLDRRARGQHGATATSASTDNGKWDPSTWPKECFGAGLPRGAPRRARPLGAHQGRGHRQLPVHRPQHLERRPARRSGEARTLRGRAAQHAGGRSDPAAGDPPHRALLRPVHGLRGPRGRRAPAGAGKREDAMRAMAAHPPEALAHPAARGTRIRVYVWDAVVRNTHWLIARHGRPHRHRPVHRPSLRLPRRRRPARTS